jgi:hypothetical protein
MEMTASASFYRCTTTGPIGATLQPTVRLHGDLLNDGLRGINRIGMGEYDHLLPKKYREGGSTGKSADYQAGAEHAQLVAQYAPKSAIEYILAWKQVFPQAHRHIPEIAHLPLPKNSKKPAFKQGFLDRLRAIHEA